MTNATLAAIVPLICIAASQVAPIEESSIRVATFIAAIGVALVFAWRARGDRDKIISAVRELQRVVTDLPCRKNGCIVKPPSDSGSKLSNMIEEDSKL